MKSSRVCIAACVVAALIVVLGAGRGFIASASATYDEPMHLFSGYLTLRGMRRPPLARWHPLLCEAWAAAPLLKLGPSMMMGAGNLWYDHADLFLYKNSVDAEKMLNVARLWSLATWSALMLIVVAAWAYSLGGATAAACAAFLAAVFPPWISNASLVTTDAGCTALFALAFWLLAAPERSRWRWAAAGAALGLAMAAKFSLFIAPVFAGLGLLLERRFKNSPGAPSPGELAIGVAAAAGALALVYCRSGLGLYVEGLVNTIGGLSGGRASFLGGHYSTTGTWLYFPVAFMIKTPLPVIILAAGAAVAWLRRPSREFFWVLFPAATFFAAACTSKTQIGYRHILPIYPFLLVMCGWACSRLAARRPGILAIAVLLCWQAASTLGAHPYELSYFNELIGRGRSHEWLVDSNLDWGQDLKTLAAELKRRGNPPVYLSYFGSADPFYYGLKYVPVAYVNNVSRREGAIAAAAQPEWLAVSATNLQGVYFADHSIFDWLKGREPAFVAGKSLFLYDLTGDLEGRRRLSRLAEAASVNNGADSR